MRLQPLTPASTDVNTSAHVKIAGGCLTANNVHLQRWRKRPTDRGWRKQSILLLHPFYLRNSDAARTEPRRINCTLVLRATGSLTAGNAEKGFNTIGISMLYRFKVLDRSDTSAQTICDWFCASTRHRFCVSKPLTIKELRYLTLISGKSFLQVRSVRWSFVLRATGFRPLRRSCVTPRRPRDPSVSFALARSTFVGTARLSHPTLLRADALCP
uniref:RxLR effector candidate protein n=1 Tax=Hyaloperonospora arabidopsidis (strain Emoy2) TaxID=559515 RepID=M4C3N7_HYAAE